MNYRIKTVGIRIIIITIAALIMATNIKTFVRTGDLFPGGATGLTILIQRISESFFQIALPFSFINFILNAIPLYIGFRYIGKKFTLYSCLMILLTGFFTDLIPSYVITYDTLLISIFGGMINGFVISLCLLVEATSGGTDFIAIYFSEKTGADSFHMILGFNAIIFCIAGFLFGWDKALYSIIFQYVSTQILHFMYKQYQQITLFVVTNKAAEVCDAISNISHHGATIMEGHGSYNGEGRAIVYSVISSSESKKVIQAIRSIDQNAFINSLKTEQLQGRFYQKPKE